MEQLNIIAVTQARSGSTRLPGKVLLEIAGKSLLEIHIYRILKSKKINKLIVATTSGAVDDKIEQLCKNMHIETFRGSEQDVLERFYKAVEFKQPTHIVRLTSDCPLIDSDLIDSVIDFTLKNDYDYCSNTLVEHYPDGQDIEVFKFSALEYAFKNAENKYQREHVTPFIRENSTFYGKTFFKSGNYPCHENFGSVRLTVDEPNDFEAIKILVNDLGISNSWIEYAKYYNSNKKINELNSSIKRNEGFKK